MKPRSIWTGHLKLALIFCPVNLYKGTSEPERVEFTRINRTTGNKLKTEWKDSLTDAVVESKDIAKGFEVAKGKYIEITDDEIETTAPASASLIDVREFVPANAIPATSHEEHCFLAPDGEAAQEAFAVIRRAIEAEGVAGLAQFVGVRSSQERLIAITPCGSGLQVAKLRYPAELRDPNACFADIDAKAAKASSLEELVELAQELVAANVRAGFHPQRYRDRYQGALVNLVKTKIAGGMLKPPARETRPPKMTSLSDAVRRSVEQVRAKPAKKRA